MIFTMDIMIRKVDLFKIKLIEFLSEWDGEPDSQGISQYIYGNQLIFDKSPNNSFYKKYFSDLIGDDFVLDNYMLFRLMGNKMNDLERIVNFDDEGLLNDEIVRFLDGISEIDTYAIILLRDEEEIDKRYRVNSSEELKTVIYRCLNWDLPEGAFISKL